VSSAGFLEIGSGSLCLLGAFLPLLLVLAPEKREKGGRGDGIVVREDRGEGGGRQGTHVSLETIVESLLERVTVADELGQGVISVTLLKLRNHVLAIRVLVRQHGVHSARRGSKQ